MKTIQVTIGDVTCWIGENVYAAHGRIRLGTIKTRCWMGKKLLYVPNFVVVADLDQVMHTLAKPDTRNVWERTFRYQLARMLEFQNILPAHVDQVFVARLNPTHRLYLWGWKNNSTDLTPKLTALSRIIQRNQASVYTPNGLCVAD
jgi:hypothetical protein